MPQYTSSAPADLVGSPAPAVTAPAPTSAAPCPPWCVLEPGHDLDAFEPDGSIGRTHHATERMAGGCLIEVRAYETIGPDGRRELDAPTVFRTPLEEPRGEDEMTLAAADELGAGLREAVAAIADVPRTR